MATVKEKSRATIKAELKAKCFDAGVGTKGFKFISKNMYEMLRPKCTLVVGRHVFKLRYVQDMDSPFEEDQPTDTELTIGTINIDDYALVTSPSQVALNMFMMLNSACEQNGGTRYKLEDKAREAKIEYDSFELIDKASDLIRNSGELEAKAALHVLTGVNTLEDSVMSVRLTLRKMANANPSPIVSAFDDSKTVIKYKFNAARYLGHLLVDDAETSVRWAGNGNLILQGGLGKSISDEFALFCLTQEGKAVLDAIDDKLNM